jgi:DNA-binding PadR family transcriptional regulator
MRDEGWGPSPRSGGPEWGSRHGHGPGRFGGGRGPGFPGGPGFRGGREFPGGPDFAEGRNFEGRSFEGRGFPGGREFGAGPGGPGFPGGRGRGRGRGEDGPGPDFGPGGPGGRGGRGGPGGRGRHGGHGGFPGGPADFGFGDFPGGPFGPRGFGRGTRARKGDVRAAILDLFAEDEARTWNGYQLIQEIPARTDGSWRVSAGSVYPALQQLEDEGLIAPQGAGRRRVYTLTDEGRTYVTAHADELRASWDAAAGMTDDDAIEFRNLIRQVMMAVMEVRRAGSAEQVEQARAVLAQARKSLYLILAGEESATDAESADTAPEDTAPEDTGPQDTAPQDDSPED